MTDAEINRALRRGYAATYRAKNRAKHNQHMKIYMRNYRARNAAYVKENRAQRNARYHQTIQLRKAA